MATSDSATACQSTMTLGGPLDRLVCPDAPELPVHHCEKPAGHKDDHAADGMTWTAVTITVPISL